MTQMADTRGRIIQEAAVLFTNRGFDGTSVRDIAGRTGVNLSLISYYFGGKQGLLEALVVDFLEGYMAHLEDISIREGKNAFERMMDMAEHILLYMQQHHQRARFVLREMTLDSMLIRELTSTYLMKEKHLYSVVLQDGVKEGVFHPGVSHWTIMHFRSMILMPFLHHQYVREVFHMQPQQAPFVILYLKEIRNWMYSALVTPGHTEQKRPRPVHL
ncbi:forespore capture DNA-binding protein RefZ [Salibacterium halotolerans]|uniref:DNA-binding transcriptional regulator, AcrR family n=1 Tax=Salibacterium halotolerans TaxID=1884432 RepID=A0A1I5VIY8_9BACI|nr:forespore capture DNA-binding protein RefZ [Salibacterium halotolerans]SFQ07440.1 DNA-binding transcriptional regulator, AcrR family [Salibacterium halotolerans]